MFVIAKGPRNKASYLGFDADGHHEWTTDRLDAIRFDTNDDVQECCGSYLKTGAKLLTVGDWDGHYETYGDYEIQVYKDDLKGKPGGHRWRYRFGLIVATRAYTYAPCNMGYTSHDEALRAAKTAVSRQRAKSFVNGTV